MQSSTKHLDLRGDEPFERLGQRRIRVLHGPVGVACEVDLLSSEVDLLSVVGAPSPVLTGTLEW